MFPIVSIYQVSIALLFYVTRSFVVHIRILCLMILLALVCIIKINNLLLGV